MKPSSTPKPGKQAIVPPPQAYALSPGKLFALMFALCLAAYWPALGGGFLWDDSGHVTAPALQSWSGLMRIWFEPGATQQYYPLLHTAFWIEHRLWGDSTFGYHVINVLWHAISACLFVAILRRLAIPAATLAGLVFALHPVAVESVAWMSEQKNTLSTVFCLAATLGWLMFQMGGIGPMFGQYFHFNHSAPEKLPYAIQRYRDESLRLLTVMNQQLAQTEYLAGDDYTIADMITYPWVYNPIFLDPEASELSHVMRWIETIKARPAVARAMAIEFKKPEA